MNKFIVLFSLLSLLSSLAVPDLTPEQAGERFLKAVDKHIEYNDHGIFANSFYVEDKNSKLSREKSIAYMMRLTGDWIGHISYFTREGFLKMKFFNESKYDAYLIAKPNMYIEGGYMLNKLVLIDQEAS